MRFVVGLAAGAALAAAAYVYAQRNENLRAALEGIETDIRAGDKAALQARLEAGLTEVRSQVQQRVGTQGDWAAEAEAGATAETDAAPAPTEPATPPAAEA